MIRELIAVAWYAAKVWRHDGFDTVRRALRETR